MEGVAVLEVDLVLTLGDLVVGRLDLEPHLGEREDDLAPEILREIGRRQVEVAAGVLKLRGRSAVEHLEEEELQFRPGVEDIAVFCRVLHRPPEDVARVALERRAVRLADVADEPGDALLPGPPREEAVGRDIGLEHHIRLLDPDEPLDRRPVEPDTVGQRLPDLLRRDGDVLGHTQKIGELQSEEPDVVLLDALEHCRDVVTRHVEGNFLPILFIRCPYRSIRAFPDHPRWRGTGRP